jgi:hypothetical protein
MKGSITATYPEFGALPLTIKLLLLTSENFFFDLRTAAADPQERCAATVSFTVSKPQLAFALNPWSLN